VSLPAGPGFETFLRHDDVKLPLVLIGFDPVVVPVCGVLNPTYQFFSCTELGDKSVAG